jgi:hypothetical protein
VAGAETYRDLAEAAWSWTVDQVCDDDGPWLPESVDEGTPQAATWERDYLYIGIAGTSLALAEMAQHRPFTEREQRLADDVVARLGRQSRTSDHPSLYGGLGGIVTGLRHLAPGAERDAPRRIGELRTPAGWVSQEPGPYRDMVLTDIIGGGAGIVLAALWAGGALDGPARAVPGPELLARDGRRRVRAGGRGRGPRPSRSHRGGCPWC